MCSSFKVFFSFKAEFVIHLEKSVNKIPFLRMTDLEDKLYIELPKRKTNLYQKVLKVLYFGGKIDTVDGECEKNKSENEMEIALEDHMEKAIENKFGSLRSNLLLELKGIQEQDKRDRKILAEKMDTILMKLTEIENSSKA